MWNAAGMSPTPAADRTLAVLEALAASPEPVAAGHLARDLAIPRASLYRLLETMAGRGFVVHVPETNRWGLGVAAYELASAYHRHDPLQRMARPLLRRLVDDTGHSGHVTVMHGTDVVYVIEERAPHRPSLVTDVGVRLPAELTASGVAMLAAMTSAQVSAMYPSAASLRQRDGRGPTTVRALREMLRDARRRGYALEEHSVTAGLASVALPVLDRVGHPVAAVALTFPADYSDETHCAAVASDIRQSVAYLHRRLLTRPRRPMRNGARIPVMPTPRAGAPRAMWTVAQAPEVC